MRQNRLPASPHSTEASCGIIRNKKTGTIAPRLRACLRAKQVRKTQEKRVTKELKSARGRGERARDASSLAKMLLQMIRNLPPNPTCELVVGITKFPGVHRLHCSCFTANDDSSRKALNHSEINESNSWMSQTVVRVPFTCLEQCPNGGCKW